MQLNKKEESIMTLIKGKLSNTFDKILQRGCCGCILDYCCCAECSKRRGKPEDTQDSTPKQNSFSVS